VDKFTYLGSNMTYDLDCSKEWWWWCMSKAY